MVKRAKEMKAKKNETDTEFLARVMAEGFGRIDERFDGVDARMDGIDTRLNKMEIDQAEMKDRLRSLEKIQVETLDRLDSIERKQMGMLASLDETVHRSEFALLERRVGALEARHA